VPPIVKKIRSCYTTNDSKPRAPVTAGVGRRFDDTASFLFHTTEFRGEEYQSDFRFQISVVGFLLIFWSKISLQSFDPVPWVKN
jgi:hypothetical protein